MSKTPPLSLRMPTDTKRWLEARTVLTGRSMNAEIVAMLNGLLENDPLTKLRIIEEKGRFVTASAFSSERFRSYSGKLPAEIAAREALECVGQPASSIVVTGEAA